MSKKFITTGAGIPPSTAPISQAIVAGNYCHISGQLAIDINGKFINGTIEQQTQMAFEYFTLQHYLPFLNLEQQACCLLHSVRFDF
jgi:enamine deaminase RidA (YjgF/YER057c/UK114 family)